MRKTKRNRTIAAALLWFAVWLSAVSAMFEAYNSRLDSRAMFMSMAFFLLMLVSYIVYGCFYADSQPELDRRRGMFRLTLVVLLIIARAGNWKTVAFLAFVWWPLVGILAQYTRYSQAQKKPDENDAL